MDKLNWWKSKTIWANAIGITVLVVDHFVGIKAIPADVAGVVLGVLNLVLRTITTQPIK